MIEQIKLSNDQVKESFQNELWNLKSKIGQDELTLSERKELWLSKSRITDFCNYISEWIKDENHKSRIDNILKKLNNEWEVLLEPEIDELSSLIETFDSNRLSIEKIQKIKLMLHTSSVQLWDLKNNLQDNVVNEAKKEIEWIKWDLSEISKKHPFMVKWLLNMLPKEAQSLIWEWVSETQWNPSFFQSIQWIIVTMLTLVWSIFWLPNEIKPLYEKITNFWQKYKDSGAGVLSTIKWIVDKDILTNINESKEKINQEIEEYKNNYISKIPSFVKKHFDKEVDDKTVDKIVSRIDFNKLWEKRTNLNWTAERKNYLDEWFEILTLPWEVFCELVLALKEEKVISLTDIIFVPVNWVVGYWTKGVKMLFGWADTVLWNLSIKEYWDFLKRIYEKSDDDAKELFYNTMYRTWWWILSLMWSLWEYTWKVMVWTLFDNVWINDSLSIVKNSLKGNVDDQLKLLKELTESLPKGLLEEELHKKLSSLTYTINEFEKWAKLVKVYNEIRLDNTIHPDNLKTMPTDKLKEIFIKKYEKINNIKCDAKDIMLIDDFCKDWFNLMKDKIITKLTWVGKSLDLLISNFRSDFGRIFKWINSSSFVIDTIWKRMQELNNTLVHVVKDDSYFRSLVQQWKKINLINSSFELIYAQNKVIYKFKDVKSATDFFKNFNTLMEWAPGLAKSLIWKLPIIAIAWLELSADKPLPDNLKWLATSLVYLVPFIWPSMLVRDWMRSDDLNLIQSWAWAFLFLIDGYFWIKAISWVNKLYNFWKFMLRPAIDIVELVWMWSRWVQNITKFSLDGIKLIKYWEWSVLGLKILEKLKWFWTNPRIAVPALIMLTWFWLYQYLKETDLPDDIKKIIEDWDKLQLDKIVKESWAELDSSQKQQLIHLSLCMKLWINEDAYDKVEVIDFDWSTNFKVTINNKYFKVNKDSPQDNYYLEQVKFEVDEIKEILASFNGNKWVS